MIKHIHHLSDPAKVELLPNVINGLKIFQNSGFRFGIITNQSIIGNNTATWHEVNSVNQRVLYLLSRSNIRIDFVLVCPHKMEDHCNCRKPRPLLGFKAINSYGINPKLSYMIGDQISDVTFGHEIGCKSIQIGYFHDNLSEANFVATDILDAALWVNKEKEQPR